MKIPRSALAGPFLLALALLAASCGGIADPQGWASPAIDGNTAYLFQHKDKLSAVELDAEGRATNTRWTFPDEKSRPAEKDIEIDAVYGTPVIDGDRLYFAAYDGDVYALATRDAELLWRFRGAKGSIVGGPTLAGDNLIFGTTEQRLYAINKSNGRPAEGWPAKGIRFDDGIWAAPVVQGDRLYVATMDGEVHALKVQDGAPTDDWKAPFKAEGAVPALALVGDNRLFVSSLDKSVYILDTADGSVKARIKATDWVWNTPAVKANVVYFGDFAGQVYALDITTNQVKWTYDAQAKVKSGPAIVGDVLVLADREPVVHFVGLERGDRLNSVPLLESGTVRADVATDASGAGIIITTKGKLFRADPATRSVPEVALGGS